MTTNDSMTETADVNTVEDAWRRILDTHDVDEGQADYVVKYTFGSRKISRGAPTPSEIRSAAEGLLDNVDLEPHLPAESDPDVVREQLLAALDDGLEGRIGGPLSAPRSIAKSGLDEAHEGEKGSNGESTTEASRSQYRDRGSTASVASHSGADHQSNSAQTDTGPQPKPANGLRSTRPDEDSDTGDGDESDGELRAPDDEVIELLERLIDEFDLDPADLRAAADHLTQTTTSDDE
ncbi:hypothetical protein [Halobaculum sp. EA56]|uniref:hypothetical protein n=1 Tax=Halobaculum sp. EA56 TaxID=3421648 RepID=UPI003EB9715F